MSDQIEENQELTVYTKFIRRAREKEDHKKQLEEEKEKLLGFLIRHIEPSSAYYIRYRIVESPLDEEFQFDSEDREIILYGDLLLLTTSFIKNLRKLIK